MANIFDYLSWRGDLTMLQSEFNAVDNLILSRFSYLPLEKLMDEHEIISIQEAYRQFLRKEIPKDSLLQKEDYELFPVLADTKRFGDLNITKCTNKISYEEQKQFAAVTIFLPDNSLYIAYRGTDNTLIGWKEDFNMSFLDRIPSQLDAISYLEEVANEFPLSIRIGGHSKGGNLAVYAATMCSSSILERILAIYSNDGPGFTQDIIDHPQYPMLIDRIYRYIPQSSVIGRLMQNTEKYSIVQSIQNGLLQHDAYSWQVKGNHFVCLEKVTSDSNRIHSIVKEWLAKSTPEERKQMIDILYEILMATNANTLPELTEKWFANAKIVLKTYKNIDSEKKEMVSQMLDSFWKLTLNNLFSKKNKS